MSLAYQSRFGPVAWLKPYTDHVLKDLARAGEERILVCPISFTTDCLETLEELDIRHRALVSEAGAELYLCPALNTFGPFISALKHLVLRGPRPMACAGRALRAPRNEPRRTRRQDRDVNSLLMVGMSIGGGLGTGEGPNITYTTERGLRGVKRSQCEVPALLRTLQAQRGLREAWLWNTCHRFELYGWTNGRSDVVEPIRRQLFAGAPDGEVNVLTGIEAWHHLLRTAMGLASGLPGERDVLEQLQAACRLADCAGTAGPLTRHLLKEVLALEARLREETSWARYAPEYTHVVLGRIAEESCQDILDRRIVVIGGSTTSASVLRTLRERFGVASRHLTLLYRGHKRGGHLKILRKAIGNGRRIRVQSYDEPGVLRAIAAADIVVFGVDREPPVLSAERLCGCRDLSARPLTIIDFNMFDSTSGMDKLDGVTLYDAPRLEAEVAAFADEMCASSDFARAAEAAETWIVQHALWAGGEQRAAPPPHARAFGLGMAHGERRSSRCAVTGSDSS
jgi:glutamyl-tRNA reductase